jgi:hypothetical protein
MSACDYRKAFYVWLKLTPVERLNFLKDLRHALL